MESIALQAAECREGLLPRRKWSRRISEVAEGFRDSGALTTTYSRKASGSPQTFRVYKSTLRRQALRAKATRFSGRADGKILVCLLDAQHDLSGSSATLSNF